MLPLLRIKDIRNMPLKTASIPHGNARLVTQQQLNPTLTEGVRKSRAQGRPGDYIFGKLVDPLGYSI